MGDGDTRFTVGTQTSRQPSFGPRESALDGAVIVAIWRGCAVRFQWLQEATRLYEDVRCVDGNVTFDIRDGALSEPDDAVHFVIQGAFRHYGLATTSGVFKVEERWKRVDPQ